MARSQLLRIAAVLVVFVMVSSALAVFSLAPAASAGSSHNSVAVGGSAGAGRVAFAPVASHGPTPAVSYPITFTEVGLPNTTKITWEIKVGRSTSSISPDGFADSLAFAESNGVYAYTIYDISGWHQSNITYKGSITVSGAPVTEPILSYYRVTYPVVFSEENLPIGETFQVTLNGTVQSLLTDGGVDTITFNVPNGSYAYVIADISGWHQTTEHYHGTSVVNGAGVTYPTLDYVEVVYSITFAESGLPGGASSQTWLVSVGGTPKSLASTGGTDSLTWTGLPNGTYPYAVTDISGWHQATLPYSGSIVVNGASVTESTLVYVRVTYALTFFESHLPAGTTFQVTVGRISNVISTDGLTDPVFFSEPNGTYAYTIVGVAGWHQTTMPYTGFVTIDGASVSEPALDFYQVNYSVVFTEFGLPSGSSWSITLDGTTTNSSTGTTLWFSEPNGTYTYKVDYVAGYATLAPTGGFVLNGAPGAVSVTFYQVTYAVTFTESGLPGGTSWSVSIDAQSLSSTGTTIAFELPNGTAGYTIGYVSGWVPSAETGSVTVTAAPAFVNVPFTQVKYTLTFSESGLPPSGKKAWSVALDGSLQTSNSPSISFPVANGTQTYLVIGPGGFRVSSVLPPSGTITIAGASYTQSVTFVHGSTGAISFHEVGLGTGTHWCVVVGSTLCSTTNKIVARNLTPGTYSYSINSIHGLTTIAKIGKVVVGASGTVPVARTTGFQVRFAYTVTFTETGLPTGTSWSVSAGGSIGTSTGSSISLYLTNGTYTFHILKVTGYIASPVSGGVRVSGSPLGVTVKFTKKL